MYLWIALWAVLAVAVGVTCALVASRALEGPHHPGEPRIATGRSPGLDAARAALRLRYARGEISREDYLQGKVELED